MGGRAPDKARCAVLAIEPARRPTTCTKCARSSRACRCFATSARRSAPSAGSLPAMPLGDEQARKPREPPRHRIRSSPARGKSHQPRALNEAESKALLAAYGLSIPREEIAATRRPPSKPRAASDFPSCSRAFRATCRTSRTRASSCLAFPTRTLSKPRARTIEDRCAATGAPLEGILVCQQIKGGVEMVLGLHREPRDGTRRNGWPRRRLA